MARRVNWILGCVILSVAALFWAATQVSAQMQTNTASEISQSVDSLQNSTNSNMTTKGQLRGTTNADRAAAAKRAAAARAAKLKSMSNTTVNQSSNTTAAVSDALVGGSK